MILLALCIRAACAINQLVGCDMLTNTNTMVDRLYDYITSFHQYLMATLECAFTRRSLHVISDTMLHVMLPWLTSVDLDLVLILMPCRMPVWVMPWVMVMPVSNRITAEMVRRAPFEW